MQCNSILTVTVLDSRNSLPAQGMRVRFNPPLGMTSPSFIPPNPLTGIDGKVTEL